MDDENTKGLLVGYSLFLEQVASRQRNHSSSSIAPLRFRHDGANPYRTTEDVVKLFLDSMSLLLVSQPGNDYITACTLDHESGVDSGAKIGEKRKASANFEASSQEKNVRSNVEQHVPGPASILKPTLALRIARNGVFTVNANAQFKAHAKNIVQFVCHGLCT